MRFRAIGVVVIVLLGELSSIKLVIKKKINKVDMKNISSKVSSYADDLQPLPQKIETKNRDSLAVPLADEQYDPCKVAVWCENEGKCVNQDGEFFCNCKDGFYGKTCELLASTENCENNLCENGAICYSVHNYELEIYNTTMLKEMKMKKTGDQFGILTVDEIRSATINIDYKCQCHFGFTGVLCDHTWEQEQCSEEYCLHNGLGVLINGSCECSCYHGFDGSRCEIEMPCRSGSVECYNSGFCEDVLDETTGRYKAKCNCPKEKALYTGVTISGDQCEILNYPNERDKLLPCTKLEGQIHGIKYWIHTLYSRIDDPESEDHKQITEYFDMCRIKDGFDKNGNPKTKSCDEERRLGQLRTGFCMYDGECEQVATKLRSGNILITPKCNCKPNYIGQNCENKITGVCDTSLEEHLRGIRPEQRCTSPDRGICNDRTGTCDCFPQYSGEFCELSDPCKSHPCGDNAQCVAMMGEGGDMKYKCVCDANTKNESPTKCTEFGDGPCTNPKACNKHGTCYECFTSMKSHADDFCNDNEKAHGYRCLCEPGYRGRNCQSDDKEPCNYNMCENKSKCRKLNNIEYVCDCHNGTSGTRCENRDDACLYEGNDACANGVCVTSARSSRSFECDCEYGFTGRNCDIKIPMITAFFSYVDNFHALFYGGCAALLVGLLLLIAYCICHKKAKPTELEHKIEEGTLRMKSSSRTSSKSSVELTRKKVPHKAAKVTKTRSKTKSSSKR